MATRKHSRLSWTLAVVMAAGLFIPVPYVRLAPGPVFNTIGQVQNVDLISISGTETFPTTGSLNMTTVSELGTPSVGINVFVALRAWFDPDEKVVPREAIFPEGQTADQVQQMNAEAFATSQSFAVSAALNYLKLPVYANVVVSSVSLNAPALDKMRAGDQVTGVNGKAAKTPKEVVDQVRAKPIGSTITFNVVRGGKKMDIDVVTAPKPGEPTIPFVGISLDTLYEGDFDVNFGLQNVGGPSAGAMFTLGIIDKLTPGSLTNGKIIAGTGTVDPLGNVGPIGGIQQKMSGAKKNGAELFLAPVANCADAVKAIPDGLTVTPMTTVAEAMQRIEDFTAGKPVPSCPTK